MCVWVQGVVSGHSQVEARLADVSLHPVDRPAGGSTEQLGVEQLDDVWRVGWKRNERRRTLYVFFSS